jgi:hypothetical protein
MLAENERTAIFCKENERCSIKIEYFFKQCLILQGQYLDGNFNKLPSNIYSSYTPDDNQKVICDLLGEAQVFRLQRFARII